VASLRRVFLDFADRAGSRDAPSSPPMPHELRDDACLPGRRRVRKRHFSAQQEIG